jgi:hypothetical protein
MVDFDLQITLMASSLYRHLVTSGLADDPTPMRWFVGKELRIRFA